MPKQFHDLALFADHTQFYLQDEVADADLGEAWSREAGERLVAVAPGIVAVGTQYNCVVPVRVDILERQPPVDTLNYDHIVECSLSVAGSRIVVAGCTDDFADAKRIGLQPGFYRVRVNFANLDSLSADGLTSYDSYHVQLWRAPQTETLTLKRRAAATKKVTRSGLKLVWSQDFRCSEQG